MEEGIRDKVDCAIDIPLDAKVQLEGSAGLVADGKGNVFKLAIFVENVLAIAGIKVSGPFA